MSDSKGAAIDKILTEMVEDTVMIITNDLPSLLQHEETYEIRRHHKNEILKNLPEAKQAILALLAQEVKRARIDELKEAAYHIEGWDKYAIERYNYLRKAGLV